MEAKFIETSREIADKFIQSIVFIDDKAYETDNSLNAFNALLVSKIFADMGKICAIYAPRTLGDAEKYEKIIAKADVSIIDWNIDLQQDENINPEEDADVEDPRGFFTLNLISNCIKQKLDMMKLIIVYTGETNLNDITDQIFEVTTHVNPKFQKGDCSVFTSNIKIIVRAKRTSTNQFEYNPKWKDKIVDYKDLPNVIVSEFSAISNGILPNFALSAITSIRNNISRMLSVFSSHMDSAYLGHKVSLEYPDDSKMLLIRLFGETISELLENSNLDTKELVYDWIDYHISDQNLRILDKEIPRTKMILKNLLSSYGLDILKKYERHIETSLSKSVKNALKQNPAMLFEYDGVDINKSNVDFAILTHQKNSYNLINNIHNLSLGTVVKQKDSEGYKYLICIQQRCDSVRITDNQERRFLFLPLVEIDNPQKIKEKDIPIFVDGLKLFPDFTSYALKTIKFKPNNGDTTIRAIEKDGMFVFESIYDNGLYEWVAELKDLHSQRIVNNYCFQLSRVGLDESEWLRLSAKTI